MTGKKIKEKVKLILLNIGFILLSFLTLIPILYAFSISISGSNSIISTEFHILPKTITMDNYITILTERPFGRWFVNSLLLSALTVLLTMLVAVPAAYVFSRMQFAGRKRTLHILLVLNAFPAILSMFAIYRIIKTLNLLNSYMGLVFIYAGSMAIFVFWNMKGYFDSIPEAIEDAARIDGANDFRILFQLVIPLTKATMAVVLLFYAVARWNDWFQASIYLRERSKYPLQLYLREILINSSTDSMTNGAATGQDVLAMSESIKYATVMVSTLPILAIYPFLQKYFVKGVMIGAVKE